MPQHPRCSECPRVRPSPRSARQDGMSAVACSRSNVSWAKISLTKPPPTPAPSRLRNDLNRAKLEIPIDHHRSPAGSCMGGFRTPDGIRKPSPWWSFRRCGAYLVSRHSASLANDEPRAGYSGRPCMTQNLCKTRNATLYLSRSVYEPDGSAVRAKSSLVVGPREVGSDP
jgi:hypothetical protein